MAIPTVAIWACRTWAHRLRLIRFCICFQELDVIVPPLNDVRWTEMNKGRAGHRERRDSDDARHRSGRGTHADGQTATGSERQEERRTDGHQAAHYKTVRCRKARHRDRAQHTLTREKRSERSERNTPKRSERAERAKHTLTREKRSERSEPNTH